MLDPDLLDRGLLDPDLYPKRPRVRVLGGSWYAPTEQVSPGAFIEHLTTAGLEYSLGYAVTESQ